MPTTVISLHGCGPSDQLPRLGDAALTVEQAQKELSSRNTENEVLRSAMDDMRRQNEVLMKELKTTRTEKADLLVQIDRHELELQKWGEQVWRDEGVEMQKEQEQEEEEEEEQGEEEKWTAAEERRCCYLLSIIDELRMTKEAMRAKAAQLLDENNIIEKWAAKASKLVPKLQAALAKSKARIAELEGALTNASSSSEGREKADGEARWTCCKSPANCQCFNGPSGFYCPTNWQPASYHKN